MTRMLIGLSELIDQFDVLLLDAWGVLHDGEKAYPHVTETLAKLREIDKTTIVVSNSPRSQESVMATLAQNGIPNDAYDFLHCSGQEGVYFFNEPHSFGQKCYHLGELSHRLIFDHVPLKRVENMADADFILNTGFLMDEAGKDEVCTLLNLEAQQQNPKPMVCLNPDKSVYVGGNRVLCAGFYAEIYASKGGRVHYIGKPYSEIYRRALKLAGVKADARALIIGDSFETDIWGGQKAGIPSILTLTGIHHRELIIDGQYRPEALATLVKSFGFGPTYVIDQVRF